MIFKLSSLSFSLLLKYSKYESFLTLKLIFLEEEGGWDELMRSFRQSRKIVLIAEKRASQLLLTLFCQVTK